MIAAVFGIRQIRSNDLPTVHLLHLALIAGFTGTWLGVWWVEHRPSGIYDWITWQKTNGCASDHYGTQGLIGFPLRFEGAGGGGAAEYLPVSKGLWSFVANFLILTTAAAGLLGWASRFRRSRAANTTVSALRPAQPRRRTLELGARQEFAPSEIALFAVATLGLLSGCASMLYWLD